MSFYLAYNPCDGSMYNTFSLIIIIIATILLQYWIVGAVKYNTLVANVFLQITLATRVK
jgi:hypothetical protein